MVYNTTAAPTRLVLPPPAAETHWGLPQGRSVERRWRWLVCLSVSGVPYEVEGKAGSGVCLGVGGSGLPPVYSVPDSWRPPRLADGTPPLGWPEWFTERQPGLEDKRPGPPPITHIEHTHSTTVPHSRGVSPTLRDPLRQVGVWRGDLATTGL